MCEVRHSQACLLTCDRDYALVGLLASRARAFVGYGDIQQHHHRQQGFIPPANPTEVEHSHVFVFNNIFFSYAADSPDAYKAVSGEELSLFAKLGLEVQHKHKAVSAEVGRFCLALSCLFL